MREILFICTGNYYRSRFAEAVFNHHAQLTGRELRAFSRGLAIHLAEGDLSHYTEQALRDRQIERTNTGPTRIALTEDALARAHRVIALKHDEHRPLMEAQFPAWADKITYWAVHDLDFAQPPEALAQIEVHVMDLLRTL